MLSVAIKKPGQRNMAETPRSIIERLVAFPGTGKMQANAVTNTAETNTAGNTKAKRRLTPVALRTGKKIAAHQIKAMPENGPINAASSDSVKRAKPDMKNTLRIRVDK
ncbi:hypothetical protein GCM10023156_57160 [Novipirellula rosea]|uniref:Uncharacterized protein n=1 Tax=Novipirellula rosea TaxID=1031540 RepID=A0ABP8NKV6_9BACT